MAAFLNDMGYHAYALKGGFMAWERAGYPIEAKEAEEIPTGTLCSECGEPVETHNSHRNAEV